MGVACYSMYKTLIGKTRFFYVIAQRPCLSCLLVRNVFGDIQHIRNLKQRPFFIQSQTISTSNLILENIS